MDDSRLVRKVIEKELLGEGYQVESFADGPAIIEAVGGGEPDLVLTDLMMPGMDGFGVLSAVKESRPHLPVIMVTGSDELDDAMKAMRMGAFDYVTKPVESEDLFATITRALRMARLEEENRRYTEELARRDEKMREELDLAKTIHRGLLPEELPEVEGLSLGLSFVPSGAIGGDFFDFVRYREPDRLGVVFSDISGHGVPAALLFAMFKSIVNETLHSNLSPAECFTSMNGRVAANFPEGNFASTFLAVFNAESMTMNYVKASQEPALIFRKGGEVEVIEEGGPILGAFDPDIFGPVDYLEGVIDLEPGDTVLLYTDGIVEAENSEGKMLGLEGLLEWMKEDVKLDPVELVERIHARTVEYAGTKSLPDDFTALAVRIKER